MALDVDVCTEASASILFSVGSELLELLRHPGEAREESDRRLPLPDESRTKGESRCAPVLPCNVSLTLP